MADKIIQMKDGADNVYPVTAAADYVVEYGSSQFTPPTGFTATLWFYRKWNSGKAECWHYTTINTAIASQYGNLFYVKINNYPYPSGLFLNAPVLLNNVERTVGLCFVKISSNTKDDVSFCICDSIADTAQDTVVHFYAIGTWK